MEYLLTNPMWIALFEWQTLVTGVLAVGAATAAVWGTLRAARIQADAARDAADREVTATHEAADKQIRAVLEATAEQVAAAREQTEAVREEGRQAAARVLRDEEKYNARRAEQTRTAAHKADAQLEDIEQRLTAQIRGLGTQGQNVTMSGGFGSLNINGSEIRDILPELGPLPSTMLIMLRRLVAELEGFRTRTQPVSAHEMKIELDGLRVRIRAQRDGLSRVIMVEQRSDKE